ncbi:MAG: hypothetical protein CL675_13275 [Bdellovibrionaceae bacterium]|nr:hypothetical protein [Pseudobdellovibrionaceae bacterium]MAE75058.1 hypothetical protein [Pseudobdellovibrionaceae bacterium]
MSYVRKILICSHNNQFLVDGQGPLKQAFSVQWAQTAEAFHFLMSEWEPDVVFYDIDAAISIDLKTIRQNHCPSELLVYSFSKNWRTSTQEQHLKGGIDDTFPVPVDPKLLVAKIEATFHRDTIIAMKAKNSNASNGQVQSSSQQEVPVKPKADRVVIDGIEVHVNDYLIKKDGQILSVTPTQFRLLTTFITYHDQLLSRDWLREHVWQNSDISPRSIDAQISKLKKILPDIDRYLTNVYGKGYIMTLPADHNIAA